MWSDDRLDLTRVLQPGAGARGTLVALLRSLGERTATDLHASDLLVRVALGLGS